MAAATTPAWLEPRRLLPDLLCGLWLLLVALLYADGPLRLAFETARRLLER